MTEESFSEGDKRKLKEKRDRWYAFMATKNFIVFMNLVRILTLVLVGLLIWYMIHEVEAVKLLAYDPCAICMNKTGCMCSCLDIGQYGFELNN